MMPPFYFTSCGHLLCGDCIKSGSLILFYANCSTQVGDQFSSFKFEKWGDVSDVQRGKWVTKERRCSYLPLGNKRIFLLFKHGGKIL